MAVLLGSIQDLTKEEKFNLDIFKILVNNVRTKRELIYLYVKLKDGEYNDSKALTKEKIKIVAKEYKSR